MIILRFKNYIITVTEVNGNLSFAYEPALADVDKKAWSDYVISLSKDRNSELYKFAQFVRLKPVKGDLQNQINTIYQARIDSILSQYPPAEVTGWTTKVFQAERWLTSSDSDKAQLLTELPMLIAEAGSSDYAIITDLAARIKRKSDAYQAYHGEQTRIRYDLSDRLELIKDFEELEDFKTYMNNILTLG